MLEVSMKILVLILLPFVQAASLEEENDDDEPTAEILVVLEKNYSDRFQSEMHRHLLICHLFQDVNDLFKNIEGVKLNIVVKGLRMIKELEDQPFLENYMVKKHLWSNLYGAFINSSVLKTFRNFAMDQGWLDEYDAVILLVNTLMTDGTKYSTGRTYTTGFCSHGWSNVAIALPYPATIAHEIAHLLGVEHDSAECYKDNHIMTTYSKHRDKFSSCSATELREYLTRGFGYECLWEENVKDTAKCKPCDFLSGSECTNYESVMKTLGLDVE